MRIRTYKDGQEICFFILNGKMTVSYRFTIFILYFCQSFYSSSCSSQAWRTFGRSVSFNIPVWQIKIN